MLRQHWLSKRRSQSLDSKILRAVHPASFGAWPDAKLFALAARLRDMGLPAGVCDRCAKEPPPMGELVAPDYPASRCRGAHLDRPASPEAVAKPSTSCTF